MARTRRDRRQNDERFFPRFHPVNLTRVVDHDISWPHSALLVATGDRPRTGKNRENDSRHTGVRRNSLPGLDAKQDQAGVGTIVKDGGRGALPMRRTRSQCGCVRMSVGLHRAVVRRIASSRINGSRP